MVLLAASLARGASGVRREVLDLVVGCLNARVHPIVPEQGSVGSSGDLAPLAHVAACLIGEGEAWRNGAAVPAREALDPRGARAGAPASEGGPRAPERNAPDDGPRQSRRARCRAARVARRRHRRDVARGADGNEHRVRCAHPRAAPASRPGRVRGEPARAHGGQRDHRVAPRLHARAGRLQPALHAAGARRGARGDRLRARRARARARERHRQPAGVRGGPRGAQRRQLPRRAARARPRSRSRSGSPSSAASRSAGSTGSSTRSCPTGCPPSSRRRPGSTPGT